MAELRHVSASAAVEEVVRVLQEDGGVIVDELIDASVVAAINREVDARFWGRSGRFRRVESVSVQVIRQVARIARYVPKAARRPPAPRTGRTTSC